MMKGQIFLVAALGSLLSACGDSNDTTETERLSAELETAVIAASNGAGLEAFILPDETDFASIPQDPNNPITAEKVALGQMLFHETGLATEGVNPGTNGTWSCASCHHVAAGFKAGVKQGFGEGGSGFGMFGEGRVLAPGFDPASADPTLVPDLQPVASTTVLNTAYQEVMLWNGQFGNVVGGLINAGIDPLILEAAGTPKAENSRDLAGLEIQAVAGTGVHRLKTDTDSVLQTDLTYQALFSAAFPVSTDELEEASKAIAAYERTILANQAPFQLWLKGDEDAMAPNELRGALLFFGEAGCVACHTGPALSSPVGATEDEMFFAIGFADFDVNDPAIHGTVDLATSKGRGGFTTDPADDFKFKVPQLYNLADTEVFGHGASFSSVADVIAYKNAGVRQKPIPTSQLDSRFVPLGLTSAEMSDLTAFLETGLRDPNLQRYVPVATPTGNCFPNADAQSIADLGC